MKIQQFLQHHDLAANPFADEDAQTDLIFKGHCITQAYHPTWDKIYGNPAEPATAIVFGEKGSGKTALRLQIVRHLADYNLEHPDRRVFVIQYDDFNPFLDRFRDRFHGRRRQVHRALTHWKPWDHMDAVLSLGVTQLVDRILQSKHASHPAAYDQEPLPVGSLERSQARDLLLLCACYDQSTAETTEARWHRLRRKLGFSTWRSKWDLAVGIAGVLAVVGLIVGLGQWRWLLSPWAYVAAGAAWLPRLWRMAQRFWVARSVARHTRVLHHNANLVRRILMNFTAGQIVGQPLPAHQRTDDRYEMLAKFQALLRPLGFDGIIALVDRIDEPYLINGSADLMRALVWPMLDNKLLKHPGIGWKLLLPIELSYFIDREDREFHQRARLDKQNLIRSLEWTGESLYDLANVRLAACASAGAPPTMRDWFDDSVDDRRLMDAMRSLRVPRHLFKFMYRLLVTHTNAHSEKEPVWQIPRTTFESVLALYHRDQEAFERGTGAV